MFPSLISETVVPIAIFVDVLVQIPLAETVAQIGRARRCVWIHPVGLVSALTPKPRRGHWESDVCRSEKHAGASAPSPE